MRYCKKCILPDTRPNLVLNDEGICNACRYSEEKYKAIDWKEREHDFQQLVDRIKGKKRPYDCLIPVSGGKDSTWQAVTALKYGLNPLTVTWKTPVRTQIGQDNLDNLIGLGVDHIDYQINPKVEKRFMLESLKRYGTTAIPMHMAIFNIPFSIAVRFQIPLIIWAENTAFEYGGDENERLGVVLNQAWVKKFGVCHGTTAKDWVSEGLSEKELTPYFGPGDDEMERANVLSIFLGHYFKWDPSITYSVARQHGFSAAKEGPRTGLYDFADIDDDFIAIHHYIKWYKFGFTRLFDNLSLEIRAGKMTREKAIEIVKERGPQRPNRDIQLFCEFANISEKEFDEILETFRNPEIWEKEDGTWKLRDFLVHDWDWSLK